MSLFQMLALQGGLAQIGSALLLEVHVAGCSIGLGIKAARSVAGCLMTRLLLQC